MFKNILIANRGEIACRIATTCRRLGIRSAAVYSEADADARHVHSCDSAHFIGGASARDSYLRIDRILEAARQAGADAIHPGYGFLSENAEFARRCQEAGLVFIGPTPETIEAMGDKANAKHRMSAHGVPVVPGYHGADLSPSRLATEADAIGYPLIIKARAGGGGRGMRVVRERAAFEGALATCQREAQASFGDGAILLERYIDRPRHIEVQIFGDTQGHQVHLFERDCSIQRRHQKVVEEAPAPGLDARSRQRLGQAALAAARALNYVGAGTVEFIAQGAQDGGIQAFYFMEMNTRLQVEHPVTELITGIDLVEWQLRVAAGQPLPRRQEELTRYGHAIELRLYAERPEKNFIPSTGCLTRMALPDGLRFASPPAATDGSVIRVDSGFQAGDTVTPYYDALLAKLIIWAPDRPGALAAARQALAQTDVVGVGTNTALLAGILEHERFRAGPVDTHFIESERETLGLQSIGASMRR